MSLFPILKMDSESGRYQGGRFSCESTTQHNQKWIVFWDNFQKSHIFNGYTYRDIAVFGLIVEVVFFSLVHWFKLSRLDTKWVNSVCGTSANIERYSREFHRMYKPLNSHRIFVIPRQSTDAMDKNVAK